MGNNLCNPCVGGGGGSKPLPNIPKRGNQLSSQLKNNENMMKVFERGQRVVDTAKDYLPQINLYGKLSDMSKAEGKLSHNDIAKFEKQISSIKDIITSIEEEY